MSYIRIPACFISQVATKKEEPLAASQKQAKDFRCEYIESLSSQTT